MATGVISSGGGAGVSAKTGIRELARRGGKQGATASENRQKTVANFALVSNPVGTGLTGLIKAFTQKNYFGISIL
jgi:hypothetical protein